jgi:23S rRNA (uracil1939-C5)-methyltransferase
VSRHSHPSTWQPKPIDVDVHDVALTGEGVARLPTGETVLVAGAIAGERARVAPIAGSKRRVRLLAITAPSADRVEPPCPHVAACGGCDFMHFSDEARARWHLARVRGVLAHALGDLPELALHRPVAPLGYRTRARLRVEGDGRRALVGYLGARSHGLVALDACAVLAPELAPAFAELADLLAPSRGEGEVRVALGLAAARRAEGDEPSRKTQGEGDEPAHQQRVYELHWRGEIAPESMRRISAAISRGAVAGVRIWLPGARAPLCEGDARPVATGVDGMPLVLPPGGFAQAADPGGAALARRVAELARASSYQSAVELFAGSGTLTIALAREVAKLTAIERDEHAVAALRENLARRGLDARVRQDDAEAIALPKSDLVVLDPPRAGAPEACKRIARARARGVVYVSCSAATLARDLQVLTAGGYGLESVELYDLFPQTSHVEVVVSLRR